jgi:glycosyltransferase involved in cell wall biosynthesis
MFLLLAFGVVFLIQSYFYLYLFRAYAFHEQGIKKNFFPPVSIVVCAKNEAENLKLLLPDLVSQDYPEFEIVLVDDASEDGSLETMKSMQEKEHPSNVSFKVVPITAKQSKGKKFALTRGITEASHEIVMLTDADCRTVSRYWITSMVSGFADENKMVLGYGAYKKIKGSFLNKLIRFETFLTAVQYFSFARAGRPYMGVGRNIAYTKQVFAGANGFEAHLNIKSGDDDLFVNQISGYAKIGICDRREAFTESKPKTTFAAWIRQKRRHITTASHYRPYHKILLGLFYLSQIGFYTLFLMALMTQTHLTIIATLFLIRLFFWYLILMKSSRRLNEKDLIGLGPVYEISIIFIQLYIFLKNIVSPPKHW